MVLQTTGQISMTNIGNEYVINNPISFSKLYVNLGTNNVKML